MKVFGFRQHYRMNRLVALLVMLLLSNVAALSCAAAYALCIDCPVHPPVVCADPCAAADVISSNPANGVVDTTFRPIVYVSPPITTGLAVGSAVGAVAAQEVADLAPTLSLNLRFCVFLK
jgi:hypothetical protein